MIKKLYTSLNSSFGNDWIKIEEPETFNIIFQKIGLDDNQSIIDIINALKACILTSSPWTNIHIFENCIDAFNETPVMPETLTKPPLEDIMYGVHIMNELTSYAKLDNREFSSEISRYIAAIAIYDGYICLPTPLSFANEYIPTVDQRLRTLCEEVCENPSLISNAESFDESREMIQVAKLASLIISFNKKLDNK